MAPRWTWSPPVAAQIRHVRDSGLLDHILDLKIWRRRHALRFPSFYLELATLRALSASFLHLLRFLAGGFPDARLLDPANSNNVVSDLLTPEEKFRIAGAAQCSSAPPPGPKSCNPP